MATPQLHEAGSIDATLLNGAATLAISDSTTTESQPQKYEWHTRSTHSDYITIKDLYALINKDLDSAINKQYTIQGWIRFMRDQKQNLFLSISDGTATQLIQAVLPREVTPHSTSSAAGHENGSTSETPQTQFDDVARDAQFGASVSVTGKLVRSEGRGQLVDLVASSAYIICSKCASHSPALC